MLITPESFEYVGGRCKLISGQPVSLLKGDIVVAQTYKRMQLQKQGAFEKSQAHLRSQQQEEQRNKIRCFLKKHHFDQTDVNAGHQKTACLGLLHSHQQPLHQAAKDQNSEMILLLLQYGADPTSKDSKGKNVYDYVKSSSFRNRMNGVHSTVRAKGPSRLF